MDYELREIFEFASVSVGVCEQVSTYVFNKLTQAFDIALVSRSLCMATGGFASKQSVSLIGTNH